MPSAKASGVNEGTVAPRGDIQKCGPCVHALVPGSSLPSTQSQKSSLICEQPRLIIARSFTSGMRCLGISDTSPNFVTSEKSIVEPSAQENFPDSRALSYLGRAAGRELYRARCETSGGFDFSPIAWPNGHSPSPQTAGAGPTHTWRMQSGGMHGIGNIEQLGPRDAQGTGHPATHTSPNAIANAHVTVNKGRKQKQR